MKIENGRAECRFVESCVELYDYVLVYVKCSHFSFKVHDVRDHVDFKNEEQFIRHTLR